MIAWNTWLPCLISILTWLLLTPPYGVGVSYQDNTQRGKLGSHYEKKDWDKQPPNNEYFEELKRVSKNQIVWGANHFIERINKNDAVG